MKKTKTRQVALLGAMLALSSIFTKASAQDAGAPGAYLNYAGGTRVMGMGRAYTGLAEGTDAIAWNPAGLGRLRPNTISLMHTQTSEDAKFESISYAQPIYRFGAVGINYVRLDSGAMAQTNEFNEEVGSFSDVQQSVMVAYGVSPFRTISLGTTFKYVQQELAGTKASSFGLDLGVLGQLSHGLSWGVRVQNAIAPKLKFESGEDQFTRSITAGMGARLLRNKLVLTADTEQIVGGVGNMKFRLGVEGTVLRVAQLRAGIDVVDKTFNIGVGYQFGRRSLGYVNSANSIGSSQHVGVDYEFGGYEVVVRSDRDTFSPVGLEKKATLSIDVQHSRRIHDWELEIRRQNRDLVRSIRGSGRPPRKLEWDGTSEDGMMLAAGVYTYALVLVDIDGRKETTPPQTISLHYGTPLDAIEVQSAWK